MTAAVGALLALSLACHTRSGTESLPPAAAVDAGENALLVPDGFRAVIFADSIGPARHIVVNDNGDVYVKLRAMYEDGGLVALRDTDGDDRADIIQRFGHYEGQGNYETEARIHNGYLYFSDNLRVYRYPLVPGRLIPDTTRLEVIVVDDHPHGVHQHQTKPVAFDGLGNMYVPFGVPTDVCQNPDRVPGVPGQDPCPDLELHGGIWVFDENRLNQTQADGRLYATGLRSIVGMAWNPVDQQLYALQHGRDFLFRQWPALYSRWESALLPAEEFVRVTEGSNFGWPYCYYDQMRGQRLLNPEYGGDGETVGRCSEFDEPIIGFPGHFAPNDILFYTGDQFPEYYRNGAFIAFHGSTIRDPYSQGGYFVAFVPYDNGWDPDRWDVFANGFAEREFIENTSDARHRPTGLAQGPDGSLYISDSVRGRIWKIEYAGDRNSFGTAALARMAREKETANNIRTPDPELDSRERDVVLTGASLYQTYCAACHSRNGQGSPPRFPPIAESEWVTGDPERLIGIVLNGLEGPITVRGELFNTPMPPHAFLNDQQVAEILTYIRQSFGNSADPITAAEVAAVRNR